MQRDPEPCEQLAATRARGEQLSADVEWRTRELFTVNVLEPFFWANNS